MNPLSTLTRTHRWGTALGAGVLLASLAACGSSDAGTASPAASPTTSPTESATEAPTSGAPAPDAEVTGSLTADEQDSDGTTVTVSAVDLEGVDQGWIAVHSDADGKPGPVIGTAQVQQGESSDVVVTLDEAVTTGAVFPMLHVDDNEIGTYEFPQVDGADLPVMADGEVVVTKVMLNVS